MTVLRVRRWFSRPETICALDPLAALFIGVLRQIRYGDCPAAVRPLPRREDHAHWGSHVIGGAGPGPDADGPSYARWRDTVARSLWG